MAGRKDGVASREDALRTAGALTAEKAALDEKSAQLSKRLEMQFEELAALAHRIADERNDLLTKLRRLMDQVEKDFASTHAEIVKLQGGDPAKFSWPEWSPQANTLRWIADIRAKYPQTAKQGE